MGIPGLTTYISNHSERYLENYALHDTYLVIDGNSITCQLYNWHTKCNSIFGGDYDKYAKCVSNFFDELSMCNVTPLVLIDGGCENKKLRTVLSRTKEKIKMASQYTFFSQQKTKFFPLLIKEVFKDVMNEKGIKYAQCIFEADNTIAAIARILNCPVLSYDSDFYIYGSLYIPFNTWENSVVRNPTGSGCMKYCKIYYVEKLFQVYNGLNQSLLPLAAVLLGNDYVKQYTFRNFFRHLKLPRAGRKRFNEQQRRIDATFNWLRRFTLNEAVIGILSRLRRQERQRVLNIIETMINGYINASLDVLHILGVPTENFSKARLQDASRTYKFEGDIYNLTYIEERTNETEPSDDDDDQIDDKEMANLIGTRELYFNYGYRINALPQWFIDEFKLGRYPPYFIDMIIRNLYVCPTQIEDYSYPSSIVASLSIIKLIYELLTLVDKYEIRNYAIGTKFTSPEKMEIWKIFKMHLFPNIHISNTQVYVSRKEEKSVTETLQYITRNKQTINRFSLHNDNAIKCSRSSFKSFESLDCLRRLSMDSRKQFLSNTLLKDADIFEKPKLPSNWELYIETMKYWTDQSRTSLYKLDYHIYSLLFALLFDIIDHKIGFHRVLHKFHQRFDKLVEKIQNTRKVINNRPEYSDLSREQLRKTTLTKVIHEVDKDDCWIAASFFVSNFETNGKLHLQPKKFDITIVHHFAEFQNCLRHSMNLNALLGYPYEQTKVASVFNGTLLYNLCSNFKKRDNVEEYINTVLQNSPSLLRLFHGLLLTVEYLFDEVLVKKKKISKCKKQKTRYEKKKEIDTAQENHKEAKTIHSEEAKTIHSEESNSEEVFHDVNNPFSILATTQNI